jgi:hypothetical protein
LRDAGGCWSRMWPPRHQQQQVLQARVLEGSEGLGACSSWCSTCRQHSVTQSMDGLLG